MIVGKTQALEKTETCGIMLLENRILQSAGGAFLAEIRPFVPAPGNAGEGKRQKKIIPSGFAKI